MGARAPDKLSPGEWREFFRTVGSMRRHAWRVVGRCPDCELDLDVRLHVMPPDLELWQRTLRCPRLHCGGRAQIYGQPLQLKASGAWINLSKTELPPVRLVKGANDGPKT